MMGQAYTRTICYILIADREQYFLSVQPIISSYQHDSGDVGGGIHTRTFQRVAIAELL